MAEPLERRFTVVDAILIGVALVLGVAWAWTSWPILLHIYCGNFAYRVHEMSPEFRGYRLALHLVATALLPLTLMVGVLTFVGSGSSRRSRFRTPGVIACVAASTVLLAELAYYPIRQFTLYGEISRLQSNTWSNVIQYPRPFPYWAPNHLSIWATVGAIPFDVGPHAGLAVLGVWLACWVSRLRATGSNWLDRLGRLLGFVWVLLAIGFLIGSMGLK